MHISIGLEEKVKSQLTCYSKFSYSCEIRIISCLLYPHRTHRTEKNGYIGSLQHFFLCSISEISQIPSLPQFYQRICEGWEQRSRTQKRSIGITTIETNNWSFNTAVAKWNHDWVYALISTFFCFIDLQSQRY